MPRISLTSRSATTTSTGTAASTAIPRLGPNHRARNAERGEPTARPRRRQRLTPRLALAAAHGGEGLRAATHAAFRSANERPASAARAADWVDNSRRAQARGHRNTKPVRVLVLPQGPRLAAGLAASDSARAREHANRPTALAGLRTPASTRRVRSAPSRAREAAEARFGGQVRPAIEGAIRRALLAGRRRRPRPAPSSGSDAPRPRPELALRPSAVCRDGGCRGERERPRNDDGGTPTRRMHPRNKRRTPAWNTRPRRAESRGQPSSGAAACRRAHGVGNAKLAVGLGVGTARCWLTAWVISRGAPCAGPPD